VVFVSALAACSKKAPEPTSGAAAQNPNVAARAEAKGADEAAKSLTGEGTLDPNDPKHGARKQMGLDVGVFVDGVQVSVLRYGDLPPIPALTLEGGAVRYKLLDYVKAIGVSPESIKSIHVHANNDRIGSIEGSELLKFKDRFQFQFLSGLTGTAVTSWDVEGLKNDFSVHEIRKVTIYVKKPSPLVDRKKNCHVGADGACSDAVPYASGDVVKGTRVYVDGKMVGFVKRRQLSDALLLGQTESGEQKYSVAKLIAKMTTESGAIQAVDLVAGDDVVGHIEGEALGKVVSDLFFTLPKHNHGKVRMHVPADAQAKNDGVADRDALVSSIQVFRNQKPAARELTAISEDTDLSVQLASSSAASARE